MKWMTAVFFNGNNSNDEQICNAIGHWKRWVSHEKNKEIVNNSSTNYEPDKLFWISFHIETDF